MIKTPCSLWRGQRSESRQHHAWSWPGGTGKLPRRPHGACRRLPVSASLPACSRPTRAPSRTGTASERPARASGGDAGRTPGARSWAPHHRPAQRPHLLQRAPVGQGGLGGLGSGGRGVEGAPPGRAGTLNPAMGTSGAPDMMLLLLGWICPLLRGHRHRERQPLRG